MARGEKPATAKVTAKRPAAPRRAVAAEARAPGTAKARAVEQRLAAALEQQAATDEILRIMAASRNDVQPVLDAVAQRAARLCKAPYARVFLVEGDALRIAADYSLDPRNPDTGLAGALRRTTISGRAVIDGEIVHHADIVPLLDTEFPDTRDNAQLIGCRAVLAVPLMREGGAYGAIFLWRREPGLFAPDQRLRSCRRSPGRRRSPSRTRACSRRCMTEIGISPKRWSSRRRRATSCASSAARRPTCNRCSTRSPQRGKALRCRVRHRLPLRRHTPPLVAHHGLPPEGVASVRRLYPMQPGRGTRRGALDSDGGRGARSRTCTLIRITSSARTPAS